MTVIDGADTFTDDISITKVREGEDSTTGWLTNESHTVPGDSLGNVTNYAGATGTFKVYYGAIDVTTTATFSIAPGGNPSGLTTSINASTGVYSVTGGYPTGSDVATVTYRAVYGSVTIDKVFSVTKARAGAAGTNGLTTALVYIYQRAVSTPALPSATVTYTFATGAITGLNNGWASTIPSGTAPLYVSAATASGSGATDTIASGEWASAVILVQNGTDGIDGDDGIDGTDGLNAATVYLFQRTASATPPSLPSASVTYTFATGAATGVNNGWTQTLPTTGGAYRWITTATAVSSTATDTIPSSEWAAASLLAQDGADGVNGTRTAVLEMYQWASSSPSLFPVGSSTYTWATGQFTNPSTTNGWSQTPGSPVAGQTLYIVRQVYADSGTSATSSVTWSASSSSPAGSAGNNGIDGANGQRVGILEVYQWAATTPTTYPAGTSTYTWATGVFTAPSTPNGWSLTPGAAIPGYTLWGISVVVSDNLTTPTSVAIWNSTTPYAVGAAGTNGTNGNNGQRGSRTFYVALSGSTATYSDALATSTASVDGGPVLNDLVTQYNSSVGFSQSKFWNGTSWSIVNAVVDGNLLVNGTVGAQAIAANSIRTEHLLVKGGVGSALNRDPTCVDSSEWTFTAGGGLVVVTDGLAGSGAIQLTNNEVAYSTQIPLSPGVYSLSFIARMISGSGLGYARIRMYDASSNLVAYLVADVDTGNYYENLTFPNIWTRYNGYINAPGNTSFGIIELFAAYSGVGTGQFQDVKVQRQIDYSLVVDGGLKARSIDTRNLTIKDSAGNVIFSSGVNVDAARVNPASGWLNNNISISSGNISGIGTGNGTAVANSGVSINADGTLSGAGGGQVTVAGLDNTVVRSANPITSGNITTYIANAAIGTAQVDTLNASVITAGTITTDRLVANAATAMTASENVLASTAPSSGATSGSVSTGGSGFYTFTTTGAAVTIHTPMRIYFNCYSSTAIRYVKVKCSLAMVTRSGTVNIYTNYPQMLVAYVEPGDPSNYYSASGLMTDISHYSATATPGVPMPAGNYRLTFAASFTWYDVNMNAVTLSTGSEGNFIGFGGDYLVMENKV
jgi:hypothetical protein